MASPQSGQPSPSPVVYLDARVVTIRDGGHNRRKSVYVALGVDLDGCRDVLGLWIQQPEGAKFWLGVLPSSSNAASRTPGLPYRRPQRLP